LAIALINSLLLALDGPDWLTATVHLVDLAFSLSFNFFSIAIVIPHEPLAEWRGWAKMESCSLAVLPLSLLSLLHWRGLPAALRQSPLRLHATTAVRSPSRRPHDSIAPALGRAHMDAHALVQRLDD